MSTKYLFKIYLIPVVFHLLWMTTSVMAQTEQDVQVANDYFLRGEREKALELYKDLSKNSVAAPSIYANYFALLIDQSKYKDAEDLVDRMSKRDPNNLQYRLDKGMIYIKQADLPKADKYLKSLSRTLLDEPYKIRQFCDYMAQHGLIEYAQQAYVAAREYHKNQTLFTLELANIYRLQGKKNEMVAEYLGYVSQTPGNVNYTKNLLQALLTRPDELEALEKLLYQRIQEYPDTELYADLLIWTHLQQKNFYAAYIQARAYDKRYRKPNTRSFEIGQISLNNGDYENATRCFSYILKEFPNTEEVLPSRLGLIKASEGKIKRSYPVSTDSVRQLTGEYQSFILRYPDNSSAFEATISRAQLFATYLSQKDSAISQLQKLINNPKVSLPLKSRSRLELGDIYLLVNQPWEATLLYAQVEKTQKESPLGYEAKLRNAKLSYYKGDFRLAQQHLDILKEATSREIANDAMELSMRIKENATFDTTGAALREFAQIELLLYQNKTAEAYKRLVHFTEPKQVTISAVDALERGTKTDSSIRTDSVTLDIPAFNQTPTILDDVYWKLAGLQLRMGKTDDALKTLQKILDEFGQDVLADDALFLTAEIWERQKGSSSKAMELYRTFLDQYPGSVFAAEARKRYRALRGDFADKPN